jgi:hypothetical protein
VSAAIAPRTPADEATLPERQAWPVVPARQLWLWLLLITLVACTHPRGTVAPDPLRGIVPIQAQVDPLLFTLTERWATAGTSGEVPVGDLLQQILVDAPQAPLRVTYVTSRLHVATVVSTTFYRPRAYQARYQITVWVESPGTTARQAWLAGTGEGWSLAGASRAARDAVTHAVQDLRRQLAAGWASASRNREPHAFRSAAHPARCVYSYIHRPR